MSNHFDILTTRILSERVLSKIGIGEFNNHFSPTNQVITAGNKNYIQRQSQLNQGLNNYYLQLQIPPGNPTQPNALGQPEVTGQPLPTTTGTYDIPRGWPQAPYFNPPGGPPGPPAQWGEPITNDNVSAGYGYLSNGLEERDLYFYHPDHLGSTSIITDRNGIATQFVAYMPFGESFVDEHSSTWESPYKFSGKEIDQETGLYYFGARYYDPKTSIWYGIDPLAGKYPNVGGMVYCMQNPVRLIDPDGMDWYSVTENYTDADGNSKTRVVYKYSEQYRSQKDLNKAGIKGKYIGITGYTENKSQYLSLFGEKFNTKTTDGKMNLTAKMVENLDKAIINLYRANYFNDPANREPFDSEIYTFETDMFVKNITQTDKQNYNHIKKFDYAKGQVRYQMANSASGGVFSWGDGKVRPIGGFFDDIIGTGANAIVYRNKAEFRVLNWIFPSTNDWQTTRDKADRLLNNRQW